MDATAFGRYQLLDLLGRGGMGEVWRAHDTLTDRTVALKILPPLWSQNEAFQQRFRHEAHLAARLSEPHVVPIHSYGEIEDRLYVDMRFIEGRDLRTMLVAGRLDAARAVMIVEQVATALDAAHQIGLVHRDVKPSNILIAQFDFTYLIDLGIAGAVHEAGLTSTDSAIGSWHFTAPERFKDGQLDARCDVYALAGVFHECLTGSPPFGGKTFEQLVAAHLMTPPPQPSTVCAGVPRGFDAVIATGMAKEPDERYQTPLQLAHAARAVLAGSAADPPGRSSREVNEAGQASIQHAGKHDPGRPPATVQAPTSFDLGSRSAPDVQRPPTQVAQRVSSRSIEAVLDYAVSAINRGDRATASALAGQVLAVDDGNAEAEDLLAAPAGGGEIRRLTILFADLVDSTVLSGRLEPETYRLLVGRYREQVLSTVERYEGHVGQTSGDGILAVFGYPHAHENDVRRAVRAGLEITRDVARLSDQAKRRFDAQIQVRVGVHRGLVYLDRDQDDVYGLAANLAARVSSLAPPGAVVVSDAVQPLIRAAFDVEALPPAHVKGVEEAVNHHRVMGERIERDRVQLGPMVGRDRELGRLRKSWARAQSGTLSTPAVAFRGEAGIGKSRLAAAAAELVERDGGVVLELGGSPFHPDAGLHPVRNLLERRCGITRLTEPADRLRLLRTEVGARGLDAEAAVPLLAPVLGISPEHGYEPVPAEGRKLQELIGEAVLEYLNACFDGSSGLLVAEDVHWFDPSTKELLGALLGAASGRLLVVITGRDGDWLSAEWPVKVFDVTALTDEQTDELILALDPEVGDDQRAEVRARCDGVPFYIEQVVSGLGVAAGDERPSVPDPLYEPLFARLLASPNVVPVVQAAAIIGRTVDRGLLVAVSSLEEDEVDDVIDELEDTQVLEPRGTDSWRFRHELLREVAAELAPPSVRRGLHSKVADALIEGAPSDPDWALVATHLEHAERRVDAATAYQLASTDARRRGALEEARTYLTRAITQLESAPSGRDRDRREIAPRLERGFLAAAAEGYQSPAVVEDFEHCLRLAGTDLSDDQLFATLLALVSYYIPRADLSRAAQVLAVLQTSAAEQGRQWFAPAIESALGMAAFQRGDFAVARRHFEGAVAGVAGDDEHRMETLWFIPDDPVALAHEHLALIHALHGDLAVAEAELRNAYRRAEQLDFPQGPYNHVFATDMEIEMRGWASQFDAVRPLIADLLERAERYGFDFWQMFGATEQCMVDSHELLATEQPDEAALSAQAEAMTGFIDFWRSVGLYAYQTNFDCVLAKLLIAAGRPDPARARIDAALQITEDTGMHIYDAELLRVRACTQLEHDARIADLAAAVELARRQDAPLFELRAALDDFDLRGQDARDPLVKAVNRLPADCALPEATRARALLG